MKSDFSVLIPARGSCPYLSQTLESICASSIQPKEVILINDGISKIIISEIKSFQPRLNLIVLANNGEGLVDALNTGLRYSDAKFIARLDADDLAAQDRFKLQLDTMLSNPQIVVLGGQATYIDSVGKVTGHSNYINGRLDNKEEFKTQCMIAHPAAMIRTSSALEVGGYRAICTNGRIDLAEDFDLWLRISSLGQVHNLMESILFYRQHENQISTLHSSQQLFATRYASMVHIAELYEPDFVPRKLTLGRFKFAFIRDSYKSLSPYTSIRERLKLVLEGLLLLFNFTPNLISRIIRRLIRSI